MYGLTNSKGSHWVCNNSRWDLLLTIAHEHGWEPMGTDPSGLEGYEVPPEKWDGSYFGEQGQYIRADDAEALAAAIDRAVKRVDAGEPVNFLGDSADAEERAACTQYLRDFAAFCRGGWISFGF